MRLSRFCFVINPMTDGLIRRGEDTPHTHTHTHTHTHIQIHREE